MLPTVSAGVEEKVARHRAHGLEKIQVQLAALAAVCVVYFVFSKAFEAWDPLAPVVFLPMGAYVQAAGFIGLLLAMAAVCAVLTISSRREGALLAVLIGAGGVSLHSPQARALFWLRPGGLSGVYGSMILEVVLFAGAVVLAAVVIDLIQTLIGRIRPGWLWRSPIADLPEKQLSALGKAGPDGSVWIGGVEALFLNIVYGAVSHFGRKGTMKVRKESGAAHSAVRALACLGLGLLIAVVVLLLVLRSAERGQILFALALSFGAGVLISHQVFPTGFSAAAWLAPMIAAVFFYALAAFAPIPDTPQGWISVPLYARALPIDWLSAGAGGGLLGYWISWRIHELRILDKAGKRHHGSTREPGAGSQ
ncbi:MAG TPA: hypothetical protein VNA25_20145 [Phycisphaerae bacterium]|nr:hypothetical protein [Phycisphaerae bacterium]